MRLGQPAPTLSGGEAQRVKLADQLSGQPEVVAKTQDNYMGTFLADVLARR